MKNKFNLFGTQSWLCAIALVAVIGFGVIACDDGGGSGGGTKTLSGTVKPNSDDFISFWGPGTSSNDVVFTTNIPGHSRFQPGHSVYRIYGLAERTYNWTCTSTDYNIKLDSHHHKPDNGVVYIVRN